MRLLVALFGREYIQVLEAVPHCVPRHSILAHESGAQNQKRPQAAGCHASSSTTAHRHTPVTACHTAQSRVRARSAPHASRDAAPSRQARSWGRKQGPITPQEPHAAEAIPHWAQGPETPVYTQRPSHVSHLAHTDTLHMSYSKACVRCAPSGGACARAVSYGPRAQRNTLPIGVSAPSPRRAFGR